ncbi:MAG: carboxymuconolactone decarboxylase family protein [Stellaceae bacterium]
MAETQMRFSPLATDGLTEAQRPVVDRLLKALPNGLGGPFVIMLKSPLMANGMIELFEYYRFQSKLDPRLKELATLIVAREWTAQFEWWAHKPAAVKAGLAEDVIADLRLGKRPATMKDDEAIVYDFVIAIMRRHEADDAVFDRAMALLGEEQLVDLITLVGEYLKVSLILNVGRVGIPEGGTPPLPPLGNEAAR